MTTLLALLPDAGHDQQWLLLAAERMLQTPAPHLNPYSPTVFESNPPLAIWLSALVVEFAKLLRLPLTPAFKLSVLLLAAAIACLCARLTPRVRHPVPGTGDVDDPLDLAGSGTRLWLLAIAFILIFGAVPARDFGQRDHILTLLILPYLVAAAAGNSLRVPRFRLSVRILVTTLAALGLALKPHQALIAIFVELSLLLRFTQWIPRRTRPGNYPPARYSPPLRLLEPAIFLVAAALYLLAIQRLAPDYFTLVVPILRDTYWAFGRLSLPDLIAQAPEALILFLLCPVLNSLVRRKSHENHLSPILGIAGCAALFAYCLQGTGWYYQQLPAISLLSLAAVLLLFDLAQARDWRPPAWTAAATAMLTVVALSLTTWFSDFHRTPRGLEQPQLIPDPAFFASLPPGAAVATLTTSVDDTVPPAFRYHLTLAQRYPHLWMLPAILRNESSSPPRHFIAPARVAELDRIQHRFMVEDLTRWRPTLILVERCQDPAVHCQVLADRHDNLLAWFLRDPAFAEIFSHYRFERSSGPYDAYLRWTGD